MKTALIGSMAATILMLLSGVSHVATMDDKASQAVLAAMGRTSTWGHPDEFGEFAGMSYYASGNYAKAMEYFTLGARYADKLSQLSIGLMYLHGEGVARDPVAAYAWLALAAERKYPRFVATRDDVWKGLDHDQRQQAIALYGQLSGEYGDAVAKMRMERALRQARTEMTGSLVGYGDPAVSSLTAAQLSASSPALAAAWGASASPACGAHSIDGAPITGCGRLYVPWRWDPQQYFRIRDAAWTGTVTVGEVEKSDGSTH
ncbi:sel1 repeat family protein [Dyella japonica]|uniref:sel1 repeat family protein n=1 Tax=Dyella japonica TaxID=231455 RepID=UPI00069B6E68|nr:sel1 repeat family protein [Dyella japonica]